MRTYTKTEQNLFVDIGPMQTVIYIKPKQKFIKFLKTVHETKNAYRT
jgi:hypothetical protein